MHTTKRKKLCFRHLLPTMFLLSAVFFIGSAFVVTDYKQRISRWGALNPVQNTVSKMCETHCRPHGIETLPKGIISRTSDLEMRSLSGPDNKKKSKKSMNLLAIAAGIKQKESVNKIVKKFPPNDFVVMLFHYDGIVEEWNDFKWSAHAIHVSVMNQTKWWFAKHLLHPDIILDYAYIFLWDEDLGVDNFHAGRHLSIIKKEGLEISQPVIDPDKSELHHYFTARDRRSRVHRRIYKKIGRRKCDENSTNPPCTGFVEMMAPVFSRASWRCTWHMIQGTCLTFDMQTGLFETTVKNLQPLFDSPKTIADYLSKSLFFISIGNADISTGYDFLDNTTKQQTPFPKFAQAISQKFSDNIKVFRILYLSTYVGFRYKYPFIDGHLSFSQEYSMGYFNGAIAPGTMETFALCIFSTSSYP
ncbi:hypothetical protein LWI29_010539 [Acer saccharum]|uniref:Uncharacterized protein n=1 Tax=Acer saccharum TaxID=4024 RepID=A0AA39RUF4_ACESA|nr:hypothetical protein LWI29_010539 [Acer saccharum]